MSLRILEEYSSIKVLFVMLWGSFSSSALGGSVDARKTEINGTVITRSHGCLTGETAGWPPSPHAREQAVADTAGIGIVARELSLKGAVFQRSAEDEQGRAEQAGDE